MFEISYIIIIPATYILNNYFLWKRRIRIRISSARFRNVFYTLFFAA